MWGRTASELAAGLRAGAFSARELMEACLARIAAVNPRLNAIVTLVEPERALAAADAADRRRARGEPLGVLHGLPWAVKDLQETAGLRTTYGSPRFADHVPEADSLLVARLKRAGALVIGKTNTPEHGAGSQTFNRVFGVTRNPYDPARTPGGSSGGAAAAVAAGMVPLADGTDLGASIRNPAAMCNLVGLRPTAGRIPDPSRSDLWSPLGVLGPIGRSVDDLALFLHAAAGPHPADPLSLADPPETFAAGLRAKPRGLRIAWSRDLGGLPVEPEVTRVLEAQRDTFAALGCVVEDAEPDFTGADEAFETLRALGYCGFAPLLDDLKPDLAWNVRAGLALTGPQVARGVELRTALFRRMAAFLERYDALAGPVSQVPPFPVDVEWPRAVAGSAMHTYIEWFRSCSRISVTAHPAMSVPAGFTADGLPVGLQLVGRHRGELALLRLARAYCDATGLLGRTPEPARGV
jgi:amidase